MATKKKTTKKNKTVKKTSKRALQTIEVAKSPAKYEVVVIYPTSENEIAVEKSLSEKVKKHGFDIKELDKWGVKNLSYSIKKQDQGYYLRMVVEGNSAGMLDKDLSMDDKILRYLLVRI